MSRNSYSVYQVLSARLAMQIVVKDLLHAMLICWADTDPKISTYAVGGPRLRFFDQKGNEREVQIPLVTTSSAGQVEHWDTTWSTNPNDDSLARRMKRTNAQEVGATYRLFDRTVFESNRIETKNRKSAQLYLYAGNGVATEAAECRAMMALVDGPQPISKLGSTLGKSDTFASLVALRLWLKGRVVLPMASSLMQPSWVVGRSGHVE
jgi:hypothetical protein